MCHSASNESIIKPLEKMAFMTQFSHFVWMFDLHIKISDLHLHQSLNKYSHCSLQLHRPIALGKKKFPLGKKISIAQLENESSSLYFSDEIFVVWATYTSIGSAKCQYLNQWWLICWCINAWLGLSELMEGSRNGMVSWFVWQQGFLKFVKPYPDISDNIWGTFSSILTAVVPRRPLIWVRIGLGYLFW